MKIILQKSESEVKNIQRRGCRKLKETELIYIRLSKMNFYRIIIRARRKIRINKKTTKGQSKIKAIARRRRPANGNHRDKD